MKKENVFAVLSILLCAVFILSAPAMSEAGSHDAYIDTYEGTSTCIACHPTEALEAHDSVHYQWTGDSSALTNGTEGEPTGKMTGVNDFCVYPNINWIGKLENSRGEMLDGGCAKCHAGLGLKPSAEATQEQLENIDCLRCHSPSFKRTVVQQDDGSFRFEPKGTESEILAAARDIILSNRDVCLNCHTKSGGGNNFKRGDIEEAHRNPTRDFDVHMGSGMICIDCHKSEDHKIAGRGVDLRPLDTPVKMGCEDCHTSSPHQEDRLNKHTARVNCTVCHIPEYAKVAGTDMFRDWSVPGEYNDTKGLCEPYMELETNLVPEYGFFNGYSKIIAFGDNTAAFTKNGVVQMAVPEGNINDGKINAFKRHTGKQPVETAATSRLLPLKIGMFFKGYNNNCDNVDAAIRKGAQLVGWVADPADLNYTFADTERYMGLFHEVAPKDKALSCTDCHSGSDEGRLDFEALGYETKPTHNGEPLCESCHNLRGKKHRYGEAWDGTTARTFEKIHKTHVDKKEYNCNTCHYFDSAN